MNNLPVNRVQMPNPGLCAFVFALGLLVAALIRTGPVALWWYAGASLAATAIVWGAMAVSRHVSKFTER